MKFASATFEFTLPDRIIGKRIDYIIPKQIHDSVKELYAFVTKLRYYWHARTFPPCYINPFEVCLPSAKPSHYSLSPVLHIFNLLSFSKGSMPWIFVSWRNKDKRDGAEDKERVRPVKCRGLWRQGAKKITLTFAFIVLKVTWLGAHWCDKQFFSSPESLDCIGRLDRMRGNRTF